MSVVQNHTEPHTAGRHFLIFFVRSVCLCLSVMFPNSLILPCTVFSGRTDLNTAGLEAWSALSVSPVKPNSSLPMLFSFQHHVRKALSRDFPSMTEKKRSECTAASGEIKASPSKHPETSLGKHFSAGLRGSRHCGKAAETEKYHQTSNIPLNSDFRVWSMGMPRPP